MKTLQPSRRWECLVIAGVLALAWALPVAALGQECATDDDCKEGMVCLPVRCPACDPDEGPCEPCPETGECVAEAGGDGEPFWGTTCESDADCPYAFRCEEMEMPCAGGSDCKPCTCACPPDGECPPCECPPCPTPEPCTPDLVKVCVFEPEKCATDADCDAGFECRTIEECMGTGCACPVCVCSPCAPDEECPPCVCPDIVCDCPETYEEHCEVVGSWCAPKEQTCGSDGDCLEGWECVDQHLPCACPACACPEVSCRPDEECPDVGGCDCAPCDCADATWKVCLPRGWMDLGYETDANGSGSAFKDTPKSGAEQGPTGPDRNASGDGSPVPAASQASTSSSGCSAGAGTPMGWLAVLALLAGMVTTPVLARVLRRRAGR